MSYKSRAERASEEWMTLPQVLTHVRLLERLDQENSCQEILKALSDNAFLSGRRSFIRWKDEFCVSGESPDEIGPHDHPPQGRDWARAEIRWTSGEVLDPHGAVENGQWRPAWRIVWLARSQVMKLWAPMGGPSFSRSNAPNIISVKRRNTGPKTEKLKSIVDAIKIDIQQKRLTTDALRAMQDKELVSKYGTKVGGGRTTCRDARDRVVTEFDVNSNSVK